MFDQDHPIAKRLLDLGFRLSLHKYLQAGRPARIQVSAYDGNRTFKGDSRTGDLNEALRNLAKAASPEIVPADTVVT